MDSINNLFVRFIAFTRETPVYKKMSSWSQAVAGQFAQLKETFDLAAKETKALKKAKVQAGTQVIEAARDSSPVHAFKTLAGRVKLDIHAQGEKVFKAVSPAFLAISRFFSDAYIQAKQAIHDRHEPKDGIQAGLLTADAGKKIEATHLAAGREFKETVDRIDTIDAHVEMLRNTERELVKALEKNPSDVILNEKLAFLRQELNNIRNAGKGFISSDYVRDVLNGHSGSFAEAAGKVCLGAPVNFRRHEEGGKGHFRVGVMAYHVNTHTDLNELRRFRQNPRRLKMKLQELQKAKDKETNLRKIESYEYAISEIKSLDRSIAKRELALQMQFAQMIQAQVDANPDQIRNGQFYLTHLSLLNQYSSKLDKSGWMHDEGHEMADMREIYEQYDGKTVRFSDEGPYIGSDGSIYLKKPSKEELQEPFTLHTQFVNISVQGSNCNDSDQASINRKGMERLLRLAAEICLMAPAEKKAQYEDGLRLMKEVQERLNEGKSTYQMAEDLGVALAKLDTPFSLGCLSAKDRTGFVSGRIILRRLFEKLERDKELAEDPETLNILKRKMGTAILDPKGCAARVVQDNSGLKVLKCSAFYLPGYTEGLQGYAKRLCYYFKQAGALV